MVEIWLWFNRQINRQEPIVLTREQGWERNTCAYQKTEGLPVTLSINPLSKNQSSQRKSSENQRFWYLLCLHKSFAPIREPNAALQIVIYWLIVEKSISFSAFCELILKANQKVKLYCVIFCDFYAQHSWRKWLLKYSSGCKIYFRFCSVRMKRN